MNRPTNLSRWCKLSAWTARQRAPHRRLGDRSSASLINVLTGGRASSFYSLDGIVLRGYTLGVTVGERLLSAQHDLPKSVRFAAFLERLRSAPAAATFDEALPATLCHPERGRGLANFDPLQPGELADEWEDVPSATGQHAGDS
jgi:hypothetical protein